LQQTNALFQTPQLVLSQIIAALGGGTIAAVRFRVARAAVPSGGLRPTARFARSGTPLLRLAGVLLVIVK
jgi:hypothetical protein